MDSGKKKREEEEIEKLGCLSGKMWLTNTIVALTVILLHTLLEVLPYST